MWLHPMNPAPTKGQLCAAALYEAKRAPGAKLTQADVAKIIDDTLFAVRPRRQPKTPEVTTPDELWLATLEGEPAYKGIDIMREFGKCKVWATTNRAVVTRRRFVNWLNHADQPLNVHQQPTNTRRGIPEPEGWRAFIDQHFPESVYATGCAEQTKPWAQLDLVVQRKISADMGQALKSG